MTPRRGTGATQGRFAFAPAERLRLPERIVLIGIIAGGATIDFIEFLNGTGADALGTVISIGTTLAFALYLWSPVIATVTLGVAVALSFVGGKPSVGLFAAALAAGLVLRLAGPRLVAIYAVGLLIANALFAYLFESENNAAVNVALYLVITAVAGGAGLALRTAYARGSRLEDELRDQEEREREAVLAERRWIAGELHDSIAHHLTIVAMHSQLLDDDTARPTSQDAIRTAARKALSDLRFVIQLAEDAPSGTEVLSGDLAGAIDEAAEEFRAAGHPVVTEGDPRDEAIPRGAEIILARIVRESATNVLKYAGPGEVSIALALDAEWVSLRIRSPQPATPRRDLPSTGTGLNRMAERVLGVRGYFHAGPAGDDWLVEVRLPIVGAPEPAAS